MIEQRDFWEKSSYERTKNLRALFKNRIESWFKDLWFQIFGARVGTSRKYFRFMESGFQETKCMVLWCSGALYYT